MAIEIVVKSVTPVTEGLTTSESRAFGPGSGRALASLIELNQGAAFTERAAAKAGRSLLSTQLAFSPVCRVLTVTLHQSCVATSCNVFLTSPVL